LADEVAAVKARIQSVRRERSWIPRPARSKTLQRLRPNPACQTRRRRCRRRKQCDPGDAASLFCTRTKMEVAAATP